MGELTFVDLTPVHISGREMDTIEYAYSKIEFIEGQRKHNLFQFSVSGLKCGMRRDDWYERNLTIAPQPREGI